MANEELKQYILKKKIKCWEVADILGVSANTFSKRLRRELSIEDRKKVREAVDELANEKGGA